MNKSELIEALAPRLGGRAQAAAAVEALVDVVLRQVADGHGVGITGFGTFEKVDRAPRTGRNPRTGEPVPIAGTSSPRFRPGAYFKDVVADPSALPREGLAGARVGTDGTAERAGAPASVRKSPGSAGAATRKAAVRTTAAQDAPGAGSRRGSAGGSPASVRRSAQDVTAAPEASAAGSAQPDPDAGGTAASGGRVMGGGEDITAGMITAKKAQLAKVKNDELASRGKKSKKKSKVKDALDGKGKDKKKDAKGGKGGKGKGGKGGTKKGKKSKKG